ncbi:hypothetical protein GCM10012280_32570 [Wenjunlia tyrosinilytica]|uniref:Secreted protein n=1 Tax=Wenjunlia tyrosinilytica TaxID=1544741 RepID=A0A918DYS6_9ACTN|nr:hypothetical protein GCM10012280_32570 [Wenjunlia tyrosinilytica]
MKRPLVGVLTTALPTGAAVAGVSAAPASAAGHTTKAPRTAHAPKDSPRYTSTCDTIGGTSGSPVSDSRTGRLVAIDSTGDEDGRRRTVNNPCEIDESGDITVRRGFNYAQQTYLITKCVGSGNKIGLGLPGCVLPKPSAIS